MIKKSQRAGIKFEKSFSTVKIKKRNLILNEFFLFYLCVNCVDKAGGTGFSDVLNKQLLTAILTFDDL